MKRLILAAVLMASVACGPGPGPGYSEVQGESGYEWKVDHLDVGGVHCVIIGTSTEVGGIDCDWPTDG